MEEHWGKMSQVIYSKVCEKFRTRVERCVAAEGKIFEK